MKIEYELKILNIDVEKLVKKLDEIGAVKIGEYEQKRYVYDFNPVQKGKWVRLRTNGKKTTLTIKEIDKATIDGTKELEVEVSDIEETNKILEKLGYVARSFQENRRISYKYNDTQIEIDTWPMIPTYAEVEGSSEDEVYKMIELMGFKKEDTTALDTTEIYNKIYDIDIDKISHLKF